MTVFINGRRKRMRRPPRIDGMSVDEFIARNADPVWLHQNEMWELIPFDATAAPDGAADIPDSSRSQGSNLPVSDQAQTNETPQPQRKNIHGQGIEEVPF